MRTIRRFCALTSRGCATRSSRRTASAGITYAPSRALASGLIRASRALAGSSPRRLLTDTESTRPGAWSSRRRHSRGSRLGIAQRAPRVDCEAQPTRLTGSLLEECHMPTIANPQNRLPYDAPTDDGRPRDSRAGRSHSLLVRARVGIHRGDLTRALAAISFSLLTRKGSL